MRKEQLNQAVSRLRLSCDRLPRYQLWGIYCDRRRPEGVGRSSPRRGPRGGRDIWASNFCYPVPSDGRRRSSHCIRGSACARKADPISDGGCNDCSSSHRPEEFARVATGAARGGIGGGESSQGRSCARHRQRARCRKINTCWKHTMLQRRPSRMPRLIPLPMGPFQQRQSPITTPLLRQLPGLKNAPKQRRGVGK